MRHEPRAGNKPATAAAAAGRSAFAAVRVLQSTSTQAARAQWPLLPVAVRVQWSRAQGESRPAHATQFGATIAPLHSAHMHQPQGHWQRHHVGSTQKNNQQRSRASAARIAARPSAATINGHLNHSFCVPVVLPLLVREICLCARRFEFRGLCCWPFDQPLCAIPFHRCLCFLRKSTQRDCAYWRSQPLQ
jgi:hypothetical protein